MGVKDTAGKVDSLGKSIAEASGQASDLSQRLAPCEAAANDAKRCGEQAREKMEIVEKSCHALSDLASRLDTTEALEKVERQLLEKFESSVHSMKDKIEMFEKSLASGGLTQGAGSAALSKLEKEVEQQKAASKKLEMELQ